MYPYYNQLENISQVINCKFKKLNENNFDTTKVAVNAETNKTDAVTGVTIKVNDYVQAVDELMKQVEAGTAAAVK